MKKSFGTKKGRKIFHETFCDSFCRNLVAVVNAAAFKHIHHGHNDYIMEWVWFKTKSQ